MALVQRRSLEGKAGSRRARRRMSSAARARLAAVARERWKRAKAAGRKAL